MPALAQRSGFRASASLFWPLLAELRGLKLDVGGLVSKAGLSLPELEDPDSRFAFEDLVLLGGLAASAAGDPAFGLHLAEHYRPNVFGVLDYLGRSSGTLGRALQSLCRYNRLLQDAAETLIEQRGDAVLIWQRPLGGFRLPSAMNENAMANLVVIARDLAGHTDAPLEVTFVHPAPSYAEEHTRIFRAPVLFNAERDSILMSADVLSLPVRTADRGLSEILERHASQLLDSIPRVSLYSHRVRERVAERLRDGAPTAVAIARELRTSQRTLRRRLQQEQTTYEL
ncbi:MAG: AraC family transcriptional regulator, partial [Polyangiaceae bacterium]